MSNVMDLIQSTTPRRERAERPPVPLLAEAMKAFLQWSKSEHKEHPATYERYKTSSKSLLAFLKFKGKPIDEITLATIEDYKTHRGRQLRKSTDRPSGRLRSTANSHV
jgi:hypothetical protein